MSLIGKLPEILAESRAEYERIMSGDANDGAKSFDSSETAGAGNLMFRVDSVFGRRTDKSGSDGFCSEDAASCGNVLAVGDNTAFMRYLMQKCRLAGKVQLIYIDPPFYSKANYGSEIKLSSEKIGKMPKIKQTAYTDSWQDGTDEYLKMLCMRFYMMRDLLSDEGCLWVHLDWHIVHYVKVLLDEIFGEKNFVNEIIWNYKSGGSSKKHYARKHDTLLFYAKTPKYYFEAQKEKSYNRGYKPYRFKGVKEYRDETGWYTMVNMKDVWQLDMVGRTSSERTGYATQKPEALIARVLESCTREGDIVCDFFGGSGTLASAAEKMGRRWIYCDLGSLAAASAKKRLAKAGSSFSVMVQDGSARGGVGTGADAASASGIDSVFSAGSGAVLGFGAASSIDSASAQLAKNTCDIEVRAAADDAGAAGGRLLTVELAGYRPNRNSQIPVDEKNLKILKKAMNKDPLHFIDFWSIDYSYDGKVHRAADFFCREKGALPVRAQKLIKSGGASVQEEKSKQDSTHGHDAESAARLECDVRTISVKAHDIFGNTAETLLAIQE